MKESLRSELWKHYFIYLVKWPLLAAIIGGAVGSLVVGFNSLLILVSSELSSYWYFGLPIVGGILVAVIAGRVEGIHGDGTQEYIDRIEENDRFPLSGALRKAAATLITLSLGGSGGRVGPFILIGSLIGKTVKRLKIFPHPRDLRITSVCGAAAGVGALFSAPLGGGVFAAEILFASSLDYHVLFPAILASTAGYLVSSSLGMIHSFTRPIAYGFFYPHLFPILLAAVFSALVGMAFIYGHQKMTSYLSPVKKYRWWFPALGGAGVIAVGLIFGKEVMGTGDRIIGDSFAGRILPLACVLIIAGKILSTNLTVGFGQSGGLTYPAVILGCLGANLVSYITGATGGEVHQALLCAGMAASMAAVLNTPLAAAIIMLEAFGLSVAAPAAIGAVLGFIIGRPKVIYRYRDTGVWKKSRGI